MSVRTHSFITGMSISNDMENIKERIADFGAFKNEAKGLRLRQPVKGRFCFTFAESVVFHIIMRSLKRYSNLHWCFHY